MLAHLQNYTLQCSLFPALDYYLRISVVIFISIYMFLHYPRHGEVLTEQKYEDGKAQLKYFKTFSFSKNCIYNATQLWPFKIVLVREMY